MRTGLIIIGTGLLVKYLGKDEKPINKQEIVVGNTASFNDLGNLILLAGIGVIIYNQIKK